MQQACSHREKDSIDLIFNFCMKGNAPHRLQRHAECCMADLEKAHARCARQRAMAKC